MALSLSIDIVKPMGETMAAKSRKCDSNGNDWQGSSKKYELGFILREVLLPPGSRREYKLAQKMANFVT